MAVFKYARKVFGEMLASFDSSAAPLHSQVVPEQLIIKDTC
jgi:hypothetical protein